MALLITGGGTGGHLAIALALGEELNRRGVEVVYVGSVNGQDRQWFGNKCNSSLGMQCGKILDFSECTDEQSANIPKNPKNLHSHTTNTRIVGRSNDICHTEGAQATEVSQSTQSESFLLHQDRDISLTLNMTNNAQYAKSNTNGAKIDCHAQQVGLAMTKLANDCHAKSNDFAFNADQTNFAKTKNTKTQKQQSLANKIKSELKAFFTQFLPAMLGSSTAQIASFIDTILASFLASGSISYLYYANRIFQLPLAIFAIAISTALFPMVAKSIKAGQEANAIKSMKKSFWFLCFMLLACAVGGVMLNQHIIWLLYEHGRFVRADTMECALVFAGYMVGLVPFGLARIFSLYLYATMKQALAAKISAISLGVGVVFSLIFMQFWGAFGLALAGSLSGFVLFLLTIKAFGFAKFWGIIADSKLSVFLVAFIGLEVAFLWVFLSFVQIP